MKLGIDILLEREQALLAGKRIGLLAHAASLDAQGQHTLDRLLAAGATITTLFGPEHGLATRAQDMEAVEHARDPASGLPIFSLYGSTLESLAPTAEMLKELDLLIVDLQDIGSRYYTYTWTACLCAKACAAAGKRVLLCDRPNPIGGERVEGAGIEPGFESFVGLHSIPVRHGMTIGEVAALVGEREGWRRALDVVPMEGWRRTMGWAETGLPWTNPSPNMRSYTAALLYPGACLLEATNCSEGRGTDTPFEIVGAPYVDADELIAAFEALGLPGIHLAPTAFIPTRQKWSHKLCQGVRFVIEDTENFRPYLTGLAFVWLLNRLYRDKGFEWRRDPYEFVTERPAIDLLTGSSTFRETIDALMLPQAFELVSTPQKLLDERAASLRY